MIEKKEIEEFLNKYVAVGVPHDIIAGRIFFYFGIVKYINSDELKIETKNGYRIVSLENIRDIHLVGGNHDNR